MRYVYHYHATLQQRAGEVTGLDGIVLTELPIDSMERYSEVKRAIVARDGFDPSKTTIHSLALLHDLRPD